MVSQPVALLFDIDGTLVDAAGAGGQALLLALEREFQIAETSPVALQGRTDLGIMCELLESHGIEVSTASLKQLSEHYFRILPEQLRSRDGRVLPGVHEILRAVAEREGCVVGVLTGNMAVSARMKLEHFELADYFDFGVYGDQAPLRQGLCEAALSAVEARCGVPLPAERIVVIGDTPLDAALARVMGARCLAVCTGGVAAEHLAAAGADCVVDDLTDTDGILQWCLP